MEWLIAHEQELDEEVRSSSGGIAKEPVNEQNNSVVKGPTEKNEVKSPQQDGSSTETAANMAASKKITVEEAQRIIAERLALRAEEERKKEIADERKRRVDGQKMAETRAELQDQERIHLAQQIRKEKLEKELHRKQVLEQIARDREAMQLRNNTPQKQSTSSGSSTSASSTAGKIASQSKPRSTECKIALRFPDGSSKMEKFSPQEQLAAVRLFVQMEKSCQADSIEFVAPPNKKLTESMMNDTLESLGLSPASRLEVKFKPSSFSDMD